jgi:beta-glucosidase
VISDWGSTYSTAPTVNAGMCLEMPGGDPMQRWIVTKSVIAAGNGDGFLAPEKVLPLVKSGAIPMANIDDNVARILRVIFLSGIYDHPHTGGGQIDTPEERAVARKAADEGMVLLKNEAALLPLDTAKLHSIAVIGPNAAVVRAGGGSSMVYARNEIAPLEGIRERARGVTVNYAEGVAMAGESPTQDTPAARKQMRDAAVALAAKSDVALVFVGYSDKYEHEGADRTTMDLPDGQDELVEAVAAANPRTVVIFNAGDPVTLTRWIDRVPAVLDAFYGGEETGHAIADVLFGDVDPSGKLLFTFLKQWKDSPAYGHYPGENLHVDYAEGIYVGYRYFDKRKDVAPLYPFGYGLSYTKFEYSGLTLPQSVSGNAPIEVRMQVRNSGARGGAEVVELYVGDPHASIDRPVKELKRYQRVELAPGESRTVSFQLDRRALSFYSPTSHEWVAEPGRFNILIGASSRDIRLQGSFTLNQ